MLFSLPVDCLLVILGFIDHCFDAMNFLNVLDDSDVDLLMDGLAIEVIDENGRKIGQIKKIGKINEVRGRTAFNELVRPMECGNTKLMVNDAFVQEAKRGDNVTIPLKELIRPSDKLYKVVSA